MEKITIEGNLENIDRSILMQAFKRVLEVRSSTKIEGKNYTLEVKLGRKNMTGYISKR